jgi:zinc/manganese transport system substrate-binding protein
MQLSRFRTGSLGLVVVSAIAVALLAGCNATGTSGPGSGKLRVVAAENFWGSIASQLGGEKVQVTSIIADPATDPHSYQPNSGDARTIATAGMVLVNGIGYDEWARQLLSADEGSPTVLDVGKLLGLPEGANPHQWYSPANVHRVIAQITNDYKHLRPADSGYFDRRRTRFETVGLAPYERLLARIRSRYSGVPIGYSESIFQPLGQALALELVTPYSFAKAIAEGTDVTAQDKQTVDEQAETHEIKVWVFNSQNVTPDVKRVNELARAAHIPIATVTETLTPPTASFQQWQTTQLEGLAKALRQATAH